MRFYSDHGQRVLYAFFARFLLKRSFTRFLTYPLCAFFTQIRHHVFCRVFAAFFFCAFFSFLAYRCGTGAEPVRHRFGSRAERVRNGFRTGAGRRRNWHGVGGFMFNSPSSSPAERRRNAGGDAALRRGVHVGVLCFLMA